MSPVRLFGAVYPHQPNKKVSALTLRVVAQSVPDAAQILVSDVQLEPGSYVTGWTLNATDLGVEPVGGWQWRNGILRDTLPVVVVADVETASPTRWDIMSAAPVRAQIGRYFMGETASGSVDGWAHTATQGAGIPPHLSADSDVDVDVTVSGRVMATCWVRGLTVAEDDSSTPPMFWDEGPVTVAHETWVDVLAWHDDWAELVGTHEDWS